ncbi:fumarylacetoacetate hydrolase family protein [Ferrimonas balearica]|uniref:fumarylacetoacetate hydrolase family protein n=1 Tax=Ferrimonas balearica TaxID=44012 RepID=UPI001C9A0060|nr:fumarylacetoacetate hydrolase family protein [Ferrimonas balearica]MBY5991628.1 fumarylacetoacetate hydrolase family protein [Ferrimonas balearica]
MDQDTRQRYGDALYAALREGRTLPPLTSETTLSLNDAYRISRQMLARRLESGEKVVGKKIGVTSEAVQQMLGVHQPDFGFLTDAMAYDNDATVSLSRAGLIQPRAEGEIAFLLKDSLKGPGVSEQQVLAATEAVYPCFEVVDSRIHNWQIRIEDTVADNASCGVYVLGDQAGDPRALDLPNLQMRVLKNGAPLSEGFGRAVQGNPLTAVAWLANTLGELGIPLLAGEVILSGSWVPLEPVVAGDRFELTIDGLGTCAVQFDV